MAGETSFWLTLQCDLSEEASDGPGWYVYAARREGRGLVTLIPLRRVTKEQASSLGQVFDTIVLDDGKTPTPVRPNQLIESGNTLIRKEIDEQLTAAEEHAKRIAKLRRLQAAEREQETENYDVRRTGDGDGDGRSHADAGRGREDAGGTADSSGRAGNAPPNGTGSDADAGGRRSDPDGG